MTAFRLCYTTSKMVLVTKPKRSTSIHSKRRQGGHHKRSGDYLRPYRPYLPIALIVTVGLIGSNLWGTLHKNVLSYATNLSISALADDTNAQRSANGLSALTLNSQLDQAAQAKANDMAARNYWAHNTPEGNAPWTFFAAAGYNYQTAGENLAYGFGSSSDTIAGWMASEGHRANILNNTYQEVGFGIANSPDFQGTGPETIVVAMYGSRQNAQPVVAASPTAAPSPSTPTALPSASGSSPTTSQPTKTTPTASPATEQPTQNATTANAPKNSPKAVESQNISRIQLVSNKTAAPSSMMWVSLVAVLCVAIFITRHAFFWHRTLVKGEAFVIKHKLLDIALVAVSVLAVVVTRTAGVIH